MGMITSTLSNFKSGAVGLSGYAWILWIFVPIAILVFVGFMWKIYNEKKNQWTHRLKVKRVLVSGQLSKEITIRMKRFPLIKSASVFQLEKPFLGSYLITELDSYTGHNEFSVIVERNNRIYINTGEIFDPDSSNVIVSGKHAGIDLAFEDLKADWLQINKVNKTVDLMKMAKFALLGLLIIAVMVVSIKGIGQWGENHKVDAQGKVAQAEAMRNLAEAMETSQATMNSQILVLELLKEEYGTENIQTILKEKTNEPV